jgi:ankyrin repeat protein
MIASYNGHSEVIKMLVRNGANVNHQQGGMVYLPPVCLSSVDLTLPYIVVIQTPLMVAAIKNNSEIVMILLQAGADRTLGVGSTFLAERAFLWWIILLIYFVQSNKGTDTMRRIIDSFGKVYQPPPDNSLPVSHFYCSSILQSSRQIWCSLATAIC